MTALEPFQLGLLVASAAILLLVVLLGAAVVLAAWSWMRRHERGELKWTRTGFRVEAESPARVMYARPEEQQ